MNGIRTAGLDAVTEIEVLRKEIASLTSKLLSLYQENMTLRRILDKEKRPAFTENSFPCSRGTVPVRL